MYIGQTRVSFGDRRDSHFSSLKGNYNGNVNLQNDYNNNPNNIRFIILEECSLDTLDEKEVFYIKKYKELGLSYNISDGGAGATGVVRSQETRHKIGGKNKINMTGKKPSKETKDKMSKSHLGFTHSKDSINKMSESKSGTPMEDGVKKKLSEINKGKPKKTLYTEETILDIREKYDNGFSNRQLSELFDIPLSYMYGITSRRKWKNI